MSIKFTTSLPMTKSMKIKIKEFCNYIIQQLSRHYTITNSYNNKIHGRLIHTRLRTSLQNATMDTRRNHMGPFPLSKSPEKKGFCRFIRHDDLVGNIA